MLKVLKQSVAMQNIIIFLLLNIFFLHIVYSLSKGVSAFEISLFKSNILDNHYLMLLTLFAVLMVSWVKRLSSVLLLAIISWTAYKTVGFYLQDYSKLILVLLFAYLMTGGVFFLFWFLELDEAQYHPHFRKDELGNRNEFHLDATLRIHNVDYAGYLTNWGEKSCFFVTEQEQTKKIKGKGVLSLNYQGNLYSSNATIFTRYSDGVGIVLEGELQEKSHHYSWGDLFMLLADRGFKPHFREEM